MERSEKVELTVLCMIYNEDTILLQNRIKDNWKGYTLPGGHVEPGESFVNAVIREMKEETGLDIFNPILCGIKHFPSNDGRYIVLLYKTNKFSGQLSSSSEGEIKWIKRSEIPSLVCVKDFEKLLNVFDNDELSEFQYINRNNRFVAEVL